MSCLLKHLDPFRPTFLHGTIRAEGAEAAVRNGHSTLRRRRHGQLLEPDEGFLKWIQNDENRGPPNHPSTSMGSPIDGNPHMI